MDRVYFGKKFATMMLIVLATAITGCDEETAAPSPGDSTTTTTNTGRQVVRGVFDGDWRVVTARAVVALFGAGAQSCGLTQLAFEHVDQKLTKKALKLLCGSAKLDTKEVILGVSGEKVFIDGVEAGTFRNGRLEARLSLPQGVTWELLIELADKVGRYEETTRIDGNLLSQVSIIFSKDGTAPGAGNDDENHAPSLTGSSLSATQGQPTALVIFPFDVDGDAIDLRIARSPGHGTVTSLGFLFTYTPAAGYTGQDSFSVIASDGKLDSPEAVFQITVSGPSSNSVPNAFSQALGTAQGQALSITLSGSDPESAALSFEIVSGPTHGTLTRVSGARFEYVPTAAFSGTDSFSFRCTDGTHYSSAATVSINVGAAVPTAQSLSVSTTEDTAVTVALQGSYAGAGSITFEIVSWPSHGTLTGIRPNMVYTPSVNYHGGDSFSYRAKAGGITSATATVSLSVASVNDAPVATSRFVYLMEDSTKVFSLEASDADGDVMTYELLSSASHGILTGSAPNFIYAPAANFFGTDTITFRVKDGSLYSSVATVTLDVSNANDLPVATDASITTAEDVAITFDLGITDVDNTSFWFYLVGAPVRGTIGGFPSARVTYRPPANFHGVDTFTFRASDYIDSYSNTARITITVTPVNDAPVATNKYLGISRDTATSIALPVTDVEGDTLIYRIVTAPSHGTISGFGPNVTYTPDPGYLGSDSFSFRANDGMVDSNLATMSLVVSPRNLINLDSPHELQVARYHHASTLLADGKVLVTGGFSSELMAITGVERFDPATRTSQALSPMTIQRREHTATRLPSGKVLIVGGRNNYTTTNSNHLPNVELYDPTGAGGTTALTPLASGRWGHTATLLASGKVLIVGGYTGDESASVELYDPENGGSTIAMTPLTNRRYDHTTTELADGTLVIMGGYASGRLSSVELYDPSGSGRVTSLNGLSVARYEHSAVQLPSGKILVVGGNGAAGSAQVELYDPTGAGSTTALNPITGVGRYNATATLLSTGLVLVAGGEAPDSGLGTSTATSLAVVYDPSGSGSYQSAGNLLTPRTFHTATLLQDGNVLFLGGVVNVYDAGAPYSYYNIIAKTATIYEPLTAP